MTLLTVSPNPCLDYLVDAPQLKLGSVHRIIALRLGAGGKGFNVSRTAHILGYSTVAAGWFSGGTLTSCSSGLW